MPTEVLKPVCDGLYAGYDYDRASRRAQEVCAIAARTGQTVLAHHHLSLLLPILRPIAERAL